MRDRSEKPRVLELRGGGRRERAGENMPAFWDRLPSGRYELLLDGAPLREVLLPDGEAVDLGIIDAP